MKVSKSVFQCLMFGISLTVAVVGVVAVYNAEEKKPKAPETLTEYAQQWCNSKSGVYGYTGMYGHECIVKLTKGRFNNGTETYQIGHQIIDYETGEIEVSYWPRGLYFDENMRPVNGSHKSQVIGRFIHKGGDYWK